MNSVMIFIIFLGIMVFLSLLVVAVVMFFRLKRIEKVDDSNLVFNFASHRTGGSSVGYLKSIVHARNGRKIVSYWARDIDDSDKLVTVIVDRNKVETIPRHSLSGGKDITFLFPNRSEELPECMKNSPFGMAIADMIEKTNNDRHVEDVLRASIVLKDEHAKSIKEGEWSLNQLGIIRRVAEELSKVKDGASGSKPGVGGVGQ